MRQRFTHIVHKALAAARPQFRLDFADGVHCLPHGSRVWFHGRALAARLDVAAMVAHVTDDEQLPKVRRKRLQVEHLRRTLCVP